jgi:TRAP-type mannitol/chloroaromatic compound transport system permease large subunit
MAALVFLVTGVFVLGVATPTEAAALGAIGTMIMACFYKAMNFKTLVKILRGTVIISTMTYSLLAAPQYSVRF